MPWNQPNGPNNPWGRRPGQGALDGSNADAMAAVADAGGGPDAAYRSLVGRRVRLP